MYGPAVRCKSVQRMAVAILHKCIRPLLETCASGHHENRIAASGQRVAARRKCEKLPERLYAAAFVMVGAAGHFEGFMAATEQLPPELMAKLIPNARTVIDSNVNINFFRPAPDQRKILFGGPTGTRPQTLRDMAARLHAMASRLLPDLAEVRLGRVWKGQCAATFDFMPHIGRHDGLWYALGYNFAGVLMESYPSLKLAQQMLGKEDGQSVFATTPFRTLPFYSGNPWFVPIAICWFDCYFLSSPRRCAAFRPGDPSWRSTLEID